MKPLAIMAAFALAACATVPPAEAGPTAGLGQVANIGGLRIRPLQMVEDSRCPVDVQCIWAGRVRVQALIELRGGSEELNMTMTLGEPLRVADGALTLTAVAPSKKAGAEIDPRAYRFTFDFRGGP